MARSDIVDVTIEQVTCTTDADCPTGYACVGGVCIPITVECTVDTECPSERPFCVGGVCVQCRVDANCQEGYVCRNGVCIPKEGIPLWLIALVGGTILIGSIIVISEVT